MSKGHSNLELGIGTSEGIPESQDLEPDIIFDGDVTQLIDPEISHSWEQDDVKSPSVEGSSRGSSRDIQTPSREGTNTPSQKSLKRKRGAKIAEAEENRQNISSLLTSAVSTLDNINKMEEQPKKHRLFGE